MERRETDGNQRPTRGSEARCEACGETFELASPYDWMHFQRRDGELCGGEGVPFRPFAFRSGTDRRRDPDRRRDDRRRNSGA
jgi:hypothetical protein